MDAPSATTQPDRAFLLAVQGWEEKADSRLWERISPSWSASLRAAWEAMPDVVPNAARDELLGQHAALARPDLARVHPSWWVRALKEETPAVQRAVTANVPLPLRSHLMKGLGLGPDDLATDRLPSPEAVQSALALWTERLVGDQPDRSDDPTVIRALTRLSLRDLVCLVRVTGQAKWVLAADDVPARRSIDRERIDSFRKRFGLIDERVRKLAARDVESVVREDRRVLSRLGWLSVARLLAAADPFRVRWALQHLPYQAAKSTRTLMPSGARANSGWLRWEATILRAAWTRLRGEGRLPGDGIGGRIE